MQLQYKNSFKTMNNYRLLLLFFLRSIRKKREQNNRITRCSVTPYSVCVSTFKSLLLFIGDSTFFLH